ncbi:MAG: FAD-dependent oxidoreductase [Clostridiales bacterium]|jgi:hypothetical protein|nr:FAD-dependent oxidoreductase [Clostridiales bacterium]
MNIDYSKKVALNDSYDVLVAGGGPAGCAAAVAASRSGAKTLLLEASFTLGGMGTIGLVPAWCPFSDKEKIIYRGIAEEVFNKSKSFVAHASEDSLDWVSIDPEALKRIYDDLTVEAGVDVMFGSTVSDVSLSGETLDYVLVSSKLGLSAFKAKAYVDCTGDADLIAFAGLPFEYGDDDEHLPQPSSLCFIVSNVDDYCYRNGPQMHMSRRDCPVYDIVKSDKYPMVTDGHSCNNNIGPGTLGFNAGHIFDVDPTDPLSLSKAAMDGRKLAYQFHEGLKEFFPSAFAASFLASTAPAVGIRESRRIIGEYQITLDDYMQRRTFPDEIGRNSYFIDLHNALSERDKILRGEAREDSCWASYGKGESHGIPYRSLVPKGLTNVLVAGKTISCERSVQGSVRVMPPSLVTGQAAGTAAAMIAKSDIFARDIDTDALRAKLREDGAYFL